MSKRTWRITSIVWGNAVYWDGEHWNAHKDRALLWKTEAGANRAYARIRRRFEPGQRVELEVSA